MNSLSFLLYLADVVSILDKISAFLSVFSGILLFCAGAAYTEFSNKADYPNADYLKTIAKILSVTFLVSLFVWVMAPSKQTIYLMIASELGEEVITSPEMEVIKDTVLNKLEEWSLEG